MYSVKIIHSTCTYHYIEQNPFTRFTIRPTSKSDIYELYQYDKLHSIAYIDNYKCSLWLSTLFYGPPKIEESDEYFSNIEEYRKILDFIQGKYVLNTRYKSPTNPDNYFSIGDIDHNTNKLTLNVYTNKGVQRRSYNLEDFKVFLSTGELF